MFQFQRTETRTASIFRDENNVVHVVVCKGITMDYYDALDHYLVVKNLSGGRPVLKLIDTRAGWGMQRKARKFLARKDRNTGTLARAIVQNSWLKKLLLNFVYRICRPGVPTKLFTDPAEAYCWLMKIRASGHAGGPDVSQN